MLFYYSSQNRVSYQLSVISYQLSVISQGESISKAIDNWPIL
ncbi:MULTISPECIES: hypothetical protein [Microcystis]|uniref:Uncharacterized protein n=1 Tax=Microcystis panniformis FACHB-1757 TaxID=1638788 RepID=A0A0K1RXI8_9CHRO|nr:MULTISPECIES: hypothetical protein [Microcystis]AKV66426.1 hypothetical protein VL20_1251 [Microcystis panniformis FACHB-1757]